MKEERRVNVLIAIFSLIFPVCCCITVDSPAPLVKDAPPEKLLEIHVINVDQGDCFLIVTPSDKYILVDGGNNGKGIRYILPYLAEMNVLFLDYIVASHYDADHIGGLDEVVNGLGGSSFIKNACYDHGGSFSTFTFADYISAIGNKRETLSAGSLLDIGDGVKIKCIASNGNIPSGKAYSGIDENALSVVFILEFIDFQMYFGGDSNYLIEPFLAPYAGDVDVYKVSHHGAGNCSCQDLLDYLKPEVSVIPVGDGNIYHHPDPGTISRLVNMNSYIYQTETGIAPPPPGKGEVSGGDMIISTDGHSYTIYGGHLTPNKRFSDEYNGTPVIKERKNLLFLFPLSSLPSFPLSIINIIS